MEFGLDVLRSPDKTMFGKVATFAHDFMSASLRDKADTPADMFDYWGLRILSMVFSAGLSKDDLTVRISTVEISNKCSGQITRQGVTKKLKKFAQWGLIKVDTQAWRDTPKGHRVREASKVTLNETVKLIFSGCPQSLRRSLISDLVSYGSFRCQRSVEDSTSYQGFEFLVGYGKPEIQYYKAHELLGGAVSQAVIESEKQEKELKKVENAKWVKLKNDFIGCCVRVWQANAEASGFGKAFPNWGNPTVKGVARTERNELGQIFEQYGGGVAGLAWSLFCSSRPELDDKGRKVFDLKRPHKQFTTEDKKPSQFAKHFNALITDTDFLQYSTVNWDKEHKGNPAVKWDIKPVFGELLEVEPRAGHHSSKIGYALGGKLMRPENQVSLAER